MKSLPLIIGSIALFAIASIVYIAPADAATARSLVKTSISSAVYYVDDYGTRHAFPNSDVYFSWYSDFSSVKTIGVSEMGDLPLGSNIVYRPGTNWIKIQSLPYVYAVGRGGEIRWIEDEDTAMKLSGTTAWSSRVRDVSDALFGDYTIGESINADNVRHGHEGLVYTSSSNPWIIWENERRGIQGDGFADNYFKEEFRVWSSHILPTVSIGEGVSDQIADMVDVAQLNASETDYTPPDYGPDPEPEYPPLADYELDLCTSGDCDMLVFLSPQYSEELAVLHGASDYIIAVENGLGWKSKVIQLDSSTNSISWIDDTIESYDSSGDLIAALMVGEDLSMPVMFEETSNQETPMMATWADTDEGFYHESCASLSCASDYTLEVAIAFMVPNSLEEYENKVTMLSDTFAKFAEQRTDYGDAINFMYPEEFVSGPGIYGAGFSSFGNLHRAGDLYKTLNPNSGAISGSLEQSWKIFTTIGHSSPNLTEVNDDGTPRFYSSYLTGLDTGLYIADGCYTGGWYGASGSSNNGVLDPPVTSDWWGHYVLTNPHIRTELNAGQSAKLMHCGIDLIAAGATMAEVVLACDSNVHGTTIFGDPTLRFDPHPQVDTVSLEMWYEDLEVQSTGALEIGEEYQVDITIRNTGDLSADTEVTVYDATGQEDLVGRYNDIYQARLEDRTDLEVCNSGSVNVSGNGSISFTCSWSPTDSFNYLVVDIAESSPADLNMLDNANVIAISAI